MHGGSGSRTGLDPESSYVASHVGPAVHHVTSTDAGLMAYSAFKQRAPNIQCKFKASEFQALQQRHHLHTRCICERLRLEQALPPVLLAEQVVSKMPCSWRINLVASSILVSYSGDKAL
mmetsp:Transcript_26236/g.67711  ORF Transcript_26236/g.67711 Transcript_26236/m.67711 type:complete len:119 (+) Transcript_26236:117-473(+)